MLIAALFVIARNNLDVPQLKGEWVTNMWCIYKTEHYSDIKNNGIRKFEGKWTQLEKKIILRVKYRRATKKILICIHL